MFNSIINHIKYTKILNEAYKEEDLLDNLSKLFNTEFKKDWVGRVYAVLNPFIKDGVYDATAPAYEYTEMGVRDDAFVKSWMMERMMVAERFIHINNLFDILIYDLKPIDKMGNYLLILRPITYYSFWNSVKWWSIGLISTGLVSGLLYKYWNDLMIYFTF